ncbi:MAG TPA: GDSL-type esterase/lipase family protein [Opitutus sp.]|nr:GDSL-type esterase/lipase family protein [Opitutus sp.]
MKRIALLLLAGALLAPAALLTRAAEAPAATDAALQIPATDDGLPGQGEIRRYEWFQKLWLERRGQWAKDAAKDRGALVFLGDSITQGWGDVPSTFPGIKVANRGISGDTTRGVLIRLREDVIALNPSGVVLLIGTNDLDEFTSPEKAAGNVKLIIDALKAHDPKMPVILCEVMPSSNEQHRPATVIKKLNQLYIEQMKDEPQVTILDTWSLFANPKGDAPPEIFPDLLHPNTVGYAKWAAALRPILETVGLSPAWPDEFKPEAGFESLFNGRDLSGWHYEGQPALDGATATADARYLAKNQRLIVTVSHTQRDYKTLWTTRTFPRDFVLKLEFRASPNADSGIFIRKPQLQCRDYLIAGPFANLKHYRPLDWNEVVVTVKGGLAHATCNGEVMMDAMAVPADGPIGLESDHGQMEYRRIRVMESK